MGPLRQVAVIGAAAAAASWNGCQLFVQYLQSRGESKALPLHTPCLVVCNPAFARHGPSKPSLS